MKILAGTIVRQHPKVLAAHLETLAAQQLPADTTVDYAFIDDNDDSASSDLLRSFATRVIPAGPRDSAEYAVDAVTHRWNVAAFHRMAREKQRLLDVAVAEGYDAVWLVDSDLIVGADTLSSLIGAQKDIVSGVFWTQWTPETQPQPQVWLVHPYGFEGAGWHEHEFLRALDERKLLRVRGLGACTLISRNALLAGAAFWPLLGDLPATGMWQGEDRHFCVRAERLHLQMWADAWPDIFHCYRPSDIDYIESMRERMRRACKPYAMPGDFVSFTLEPLSEPSRFATHQHIRGRLGAMRVLPEIEAALHELTVGESQLISVTFPEWWEIEAYRGQTKTFRIRLLGARAMEAPTRTDREFGAKELTHMRNARAVA